MTVEVNGRAADFADGATVADVVAAVTESASGCAVAVNGDVVPRAEWPQRALHQGDHVDVLTAVQGG